LTKSSKTALGGIISAISVVIMMLTVFPALTYCSPMVAGSLLTIIVIEIDRKWAFGVYAVVGTLSALLATDKEAAIIYITFFGYYPIIKSLIEKYIKSPIVWLVKFLLFNGAVVGTYVVMNFVFRIPIEGLGDFGKWTIPILLGLGNFAFLLYDRLFLTAYITLYFRRWQKSFRKLFGIKNNR